MKNSLCSIGCSEAVRHVKILGTFLLSNNHSSGWALGTLNDNDAMLRDLALTLRITCVAVAYRLAPENPFPAAIDDAYAGLKWVINYM